jgi:asparagine synthase (glutamine-hydrolysing)
MSAIFGVLRFDGAAVSASELQRMGAVLAHRGPDGRRSVADGRVGLGHCLLRVNQEDLFEAQPVRDPEAELTLVADCRIDNREALAAAFGLDDEALRDMPDSALILRAYRKWGEAAPEHLIGDFTFAVWDGRAGKLVLARDHMGQRQVYHHHGDGFFAFSTEIKGLWAVEGVPRAVTEVAVGQRMAPWTGSAAPGASLYAGIRALTGGEIVSVDASGRRESRIYWRPHADPAHERRDERYYVETYRAVFEEAVACRLRRLTRPAALLLSAGFDSAAIAGLAGPTVTRQGRKLLTFSVLVSEVYRGSAYDIRRWVDACIRKMPHLDARIADFGDASPLENLEERFARNDGVSTIVDADLHPIYAQAARAGARLLLDGIGGDFTLNPRGVGALAYLFRAGKLRRFLAEIGPTMRVKRETLWQVLKRELLLNLVPRRLLTWLYYGSWWRPAEYPVDAMLLQRLVRDGAVRKRRAIGRVPLSAMRALSLHFARQYVDEPRPSRATPAASFGLELTRPLVDKRVVEFGLAVPEALYVKNGLNRRLARAALADVYPPEFATRTGPNEPSSPQIQLRMQAAAPELLAEAERLSKDPKIAAYIDFAKVPAMLSSPGPMMQPASMRKRRYAVLAVMLGRHIEWLAGENRGDRAAASGKASPISCEPSSIPRSGDGGRPGRRSGSGESPRSHR